MATKRKWVTPDVQRKKVKVLTAAILFAAALGPLALIVTLGRGTPPIPEIPAQPIYQAQATTVVERWIEGRPSPITVSQELPPNMGREPNSARLPITNIAWSSFTQEAGFSDPTYFLETHSFRAVMNGQTVIIEVTIATQEEDGPVLVSLPSVIPSVFLPGTQEIPFTLEAYGELVTVSSGGQSQLQEWAQAYGENNKEALYRLTGDPDQNEYQGIPGGGYLLVEEAKVIQAVTPFTGENSVTTLPENSIIVRLSVTYAPPYTQREIDELRANEPNLDITRLNTQTPNTNRSMTLQFDILLTDVDRTLPFIAAWGTAGEGPRLEPFQNAIIPTEDQAINTTTTTTAINTSTTSTSATRPTTTTTP